MQPNFKHINPHPLLVGYIEKLWVFESKGKAFEEDVKLIVPNDRMKIAIPYSNAIVATVQGKPHLTKENTFTLTGMMDIPFNMDIANDGASGTICAELSPSAAYYFFQINFKEVHNKVVSVSDILGNAVASWEDQIANAMLIEDKVSLFQQFLINQFLQRKEDNVFEYCIKKLKNGNPTVKELEKQTGYSSRWLNIKFNEKLGISPQNFTSIIRFKNYYEIFCNNDFSKPINNAYYNDYYDQSHFIKDFKRFTGLTPTKLQKKLKNWGRIFYNA